MDGEHLKIQNLQQKTTGCIVIVFMVMWNYVHESPAMKTLPSNFKKGFIFLNLFFGQNKNYLLNLFSACCIYCRVCRLYSSQELCLQKKGEELKQHIQTMIKLL